MSKQDITHFIGIGGIGMSAIAEMMHNKGLSVQGSNNCENANTKRLAELGIEVSTSHDESNLNKATKIVVSTAIKPSNSELKHAKELKLPILHRSQALAELMQDYKGIAITGTHGKTTTTSLVYTLLEAGYINPSVLNGGVINSINSNSHVANGEWLVAEADESDGSFINLHPQIAVITNIDPEHMEHYGGMAKVRQGYNKFLKNMASDGLAILCADHPETMRLATNIKDKKVITYGLSKKAMLRAEKIFQNGQKTSFNLNYNGEVTPLVLNLPGSHNVQNALAAIAIAIELGVKIPPIKEALKNFAGVGRRFVNLGQVNEITIIDDYAHHPVEIQATLRAARNAFARDIIAVIQPHRFTRLQDLMQDFANCTQDADKVVIAPVYEAGESPIKGIDSKKLAKEMRKNHNSVQTVDKLSELKDILSEVTTAGDAVIFMGAGDITSWAKEVSDNQ